MNSEQFHSIKNFLEYNYIIQLMDLFSFFLSNLTIYYFMNEFFNISLFKFILIFSIGLILVKFDLVYFITKSSKKVYKNTFFAIKKLKFHLNFKEIYDIFIKLLKFPISLHKTFYISRIIIIPLLWLRMIFFNSIQYLLFVLIIWIFLLSLFIKFDFLIVQNEISSDFYNSIVLIGILAGFFQYYIKRYEDKIQNKLSLKLNSLISISIRETSFDNFLEFLEQDSRSLYRKITKYIDEDRREFRMMAHHLDRSRTKNITINALFMPPSEQGGYNLIESKMTDNQDTQEELIEAYKIYFSIKKDEIVNKIKAMESVTELIEMLFLNFSFIAELKSEAIGITIDDITKLKSADEFIANMKLTILDELISGYFYKLTSISNSNQMTLIDIKK